MSKETYNTDLLKTGSEVWRALLRDRTNTLTKSQFQCLAAICGLVNDDYTDVMDDGGIGTPLSQEEIALAMHMSAKSVSAVRTSIEELKALGAIKYTVGKGLVHGTSKHRSNVYRVLGLPWAIKRDDGTYSYADLKAGHTRNGWREEVTANFQQTYRQETEDLPPRNGGLTAKKRKTYRQETDGLTATPVAPRRKVEEIVEGSTEETSEETLEETTLRGEEVDKVPLSTDSVDDVQDSEDARLYASVSGVSGVSDVSEPEQVEKVRATNPQQIEGTAKVPKQIEGTAKVPTREQVMEMTANELETVGIDLSRTNALHWEMNENPNIKICDLIEQSSWKQYCNFSKISLRQKELPNE